MVALSKDGDIRFIAVGVKKFSSFMISKGADISFQYVAIILT